MSNISPVPTPTAAVTLRLRPLREAMRAALMTASDDESRPILTTLHMYWRGGTEPVVMESTDSYRLHQVKVPHISSQMGAMQFDVLIPARWLRVTVAALAGDPYSELSFQGETVKATGWDETRSTSLRGGTFPNLDQFTTPGEHHPETTIAVTAKFLDGMFKAAALFPGTPIQFSIPESNLKPMHVTCQAPDASLVMVLMPVRIP